MLIAFDLDGTLLISGGELTPANQQALEKAHNAGYKLAIATGRSLRSIPGEVLRLPCFSYCISANGAVVSEPGTGEVFSEKALPRELALWVVEAAAKEKASFRIFLAGTEIFELKGLIKLARYVSGMDNAPPFWQLLQKMRKLFAVTLSARRLVHKTHKPIHKIVCTYKTKAELKEQQALFTQSGKLEAAETMGNELEVTAKGVSKGAALGLLAGRLGIPKEQVLAFGDSGNDLSMSDAGKLVAMGNASDELKAIADYIAPNADEDGVAKMLNILLGL